MQYVVFDSNDDTEALPAFHVVDIPGLLQKSPPALYNYLVTYQDTAIGIFELFYEGYFGMSGGLKTLKCKLIKGTDNCAVHFIDGEGSTTVLYFCPLVNINTF